MSGVARSNSNSSARDHAIGIPDHVCIVIRIIMLFPDFGKLVYFVWTAEFSLSDCLNFGIEKESIQLPLVNCAIQVNGKLCQSSVNELINF